MNKKDMQIALMSGNIDLELKEVNKMRKPEDSYWTMATNTCTGFRTIICC